MTYSSDLIESDLVSNTSFIAAPAYPSIFGITFNPIVSGLCIAAVGVGISGYLFMSFLQPQLTKNQELETKLAQTEDQIQQRKDNAIKIAAAEQKLDRAKAKKQIVIGLFASDKKLDTLLLDLNKLVNIRQGELQKFKPDLPVAGTGSSGAAIVTDSSLGAALNNKIKRKGIDIEVKGNFEQVQSILRTIERLDQLLIVKDFKAAIPVEGQKIVLNAQGRPVPQPEAAIKTSFKIQALIPMNTAEQAAAAPPPAPAVKK
ncbi:pilus assembly protein [Chamaesiphon sp.]|uniref:pilus assembly protein n=1 Tax=Chamaesiphon sp. TaxID=2814140 RepID=UPI003593EA25